MSLHWLQRHPRATVDEYYLSVKEDNSFFTAISWRQIECIWLRRMAAIIYLS